MMKNPITDALQITAAIILTGGTLVLASPLPQEPAIVEPVETVEVAEAIETPELTENVAQEPEKSSETIIEPVKDPQGCEPERYWSETAPHNCIDKPVVAKSVSGAVTSSSVASAGKVPLGVHDVGGSGDCLAEIAKYGWTQSTAIAVSRAESGFKPGIINNNPSSGDYSIGCFQVNIIGANAYNRPPQEELIIAKNNVAWAYDNYVANGHSFIGQWGVCRSKVSCY